jgi:hypothetical protein
VVIQSTEEARLKLTKAEKEQLTKTLNCTAAELKRELQKFSEAAEEEYVRMILGQRIFTRGQDVREYRLFLMIRHVFGDGLPTEQEISSLFQTTTTQSRSLLRAVMSKYQYELQSSIDMTLRAVLDDAQYDDYSGKRTITIDSESVVEALNRRIASVDGTLPQIVRAKNTVTTYEIAESAYEGLTQE